MNETDLNSRFAIPGLHFEAGQGGLVRAVIHTQVVQGELYLHGAHVTRYQPEGSEPVLWMSRESLFESGKPIRGGVPICFPWFGPHEIDPKAPGHGWARLKVWEVAACGQTADGGICLELTTVIDDLGLSFQVEFGKSLRMFLRIENAASARMAKRFEVALHTYFHVGDIQQVSIHGMESNSYLDKVGGPHEADPEGNPIRFTGETDRVYRNARLTCVLRDPILNRTITVRKGGSRSTVIWNPWIEKSQRMADFGDQEWLGMVCIETANVMSNAIDLTPGEIHLLKAEIEVDPFS